MKIVELVEAIRFLQMNMMTNMVTSGMTMSSGRMGQETAAGSDFDFDFLHKENVFGYDLFGLGNILTYLTGRGDVTSQLLQQASSPVVSQLTEYDMNIIFNNRVVNLKKVYPYVPDELNHILLHFSMAANVFYDNTDQFLYDLHEARVKLNKP